MEETIPRYPLAWPVGWVRTVPGKRQNGHFSFQRQAISVYSATNRLQKELERLGAERITLSTNVETNLNGTPKSDGRKASDPGVAVYFIFRNRATVFACDTYTDVSQNIAALAAHTEALRRIDRYGVGSLEQALAGYKALPADTAADWRLVFGYPKGAQPTVEDLNDRWKQQARSAHPDRGGSDERMMHLNRAREFALAELQR